MAFADPLGGRGSNSDRIWGGEGANGAVSVVCDFGLAGCAGDSIEADDPRTDRGRLPSVRSVGSRRFGSGAFRLFFAFRWEVDGGALVVQGGDGLGRLGQDRLIRCVVSGVDGYGGYGVIRWALVFASASFSEVTGEGGIYPSAVLVVGVGSFVRLEGSLVAAGPT